MEGTSTGGIPAAVHPTPPRFPPFLLKTLFTAVVGGVTYALTNIANQPEVWKLTASIFLGGAALIVQYMVDFEGRLGSVEDTLAEHNAEMKELVARGFARINEVTELFGLVDRSTLQTEKVTKLLLSATEAGSGAPPIMQSFISKQITGLTDLMEALTRKLVDYEGEDHDWIVALTQCANNTIDATSTPVDRGFWTSELGQRYLRAQRDAIKERQVRIRRLFIVRTPEDNGPELGQLCDDQQSLGIEVRVLVLSELSPIVRMDETLDFIVFDDSMSYEIAADLRDVNTRTVMDWRPDRVARRAQRFAALWEAGE
ncbi:hypothetical protein [Actinacidiphila acididurans]|uniref:Uncharacterized protein n=1 Tax=Actinacidiphila acididurans TaxID=2784346 RepID=A0ABS2TX15_9ACTN|nr:hypothetical protein [Actinacidiphila acididurans]MBM9507627.1 hypothetical protein [Actinacidiphila acididurans]